MAGHNILNLRFLVVGTQLVHLWFVIVITSLKEELFIKIVKRMDNGLLTFLTVVIVNY